MLSSVVRVPMSKIPAWFSFTLLALTVLGGLHGIVISIQALFSPSASIFFIAILIAYIYVTATGVIFWRQPSQTRPLMWALSIQIPWISLPGFVYKFSAGLFVSVAFVAKHEGDKYSAGFAGNFNLGSSCEFRFLQNAPIELGVNLVALAALLLLSRAVISTRAALTEPPSNNDSRNSSDTVTMG